MSSRWCESQAVRLKRAGLPDGEASSVRNYGAGDHRPPSQSSKTVLSTVHVGGPKWIVGGTIFEMWLGGL